MNHRRRSLKARLVGATIGAVAAVWTATLAFSYLEARHEIDELLDAHLAQAAAVLVAQAAAATDAEEAAEHAPLLHKYARRVVFQIVDEHGRLGLHSSNAPNRPLAAPTPGFADSRVDGRDWRVFTTASGEATVHVGELADARREVAAELVGGMLKPMLLALPLLAFGLWLGVGRGLQPLSEIAGEVARRAPDNLAPLSPGAMPAEIRPLAARLDELFARLRRSLDAERQFTADAAHELRTPLAGIRAQAQVAAGAAADAERQRALAAVVTGCDRAARLVEQLLTLARIEHAEGIRTAGLDLARLAAEVIAEAADAAAAKAVELALDDRGGGTATGNADLLRILMRNLVDNAVRYSPPGGHVLVTVAGEAGDAVVEVSDDGPGIPPAERERVLGRFYRILGSGEEGSGLGLSIVDRIVRLHGARMSLGEGGGGRGLAVRIGLPIAPAS